jgi:hypothetical protein
MVPGRARDERKEKQCRRMPGTALVSGRTRVVRRVSSPRRDRSPRGSLPDKVLDRLQEAGSEKS